MSMFIRAGLMSTIISFGCTELVGQATVKIWGGVQWSHHFILGDLIKAFNRTSESTEPLRGDRWDDERNIEKFIDGQWGCEVLYHRALPSDDEAAALAERWPEGEAQPETFVVGQMKVAVIVHRGNRIPHITLDQIRELLRVEGAGMQWRELGGTGAWFDHMAKDAMRPAGWSFGGSA